MTAAAPPFRFHVSSDLVSLGYRVLVVLALCIALSFVSDAFATSANLLNVARQASLIFLIAAGLTLVILTAGLDLSIGVNVGLSACIAATALKASGSPALGLLAGIACGSAIGLANGLLITLLRLPSFIATYGMLWMVQGYTYYYMAGGTLYGFPESFRAIGSGHFIGVPIPVFLMAGFLALGAVFLRRTTWGHEIYAIGANPVAARLSGIPVRKRLVLVYIACGAMCGLAAIVYLARLNSAEADIGESLLLPALAAPLIGGTSLFGGVGTLSGTLVGALILTLVLNGMNLLTINANWQPFVTGLIVLIAMFFDTLARQHAESRA